MNGSYYTTTFNTDCTFTHNNVGKIMNVALLGSQFDASGGGAYLVQTAGALNFNITGLYAKIVNSGTCNVTGSPTFNIKGLYVTNNGQAFTGGTPTFNVYGIYCDPVGGTNSWGLYLGATTGSTGGTAYGIQIGAVTGGTTNWAIYAAGGDSAHAGNMSFGAVTAPTTAVDATGSVNASVGYQTGGVAGLGTNATPLVITTASLGIATGTMTFIGGILTASTPAT
jgi:hypothetical protein